MDSNRIKRLATGVRDSLRNEITSRLNVVLAPDSTERLDMPSEVKSIEQAIERDGRETVIEKAAYTWFNRFCALRFMDANGYNNSIGIVTPKGESTQPEVLQNAMEGIFDESLGFNANVRAKIVGILTSQIPSDNPTEAAYSEIIFTICQHYARPMKYLFAENVTPRLLMPQGLLMQDSILKRIVTEMDAETCKSVEVLGWLYQFYIAQRKDEIFANKKSKRGAAEIAPATQLFTPDWIVKYMTENSLGRLWMLNNPSSSLKNNWDYYIESDAPESYIKVYSPEEITVCDPACGSAHILVYAFDLLFEMYREEGYLEHNIPELIFKNNLFGFEIDERAAEIASFALEMKARAKDSNFFEKCLDANITVLKNVQFSEDELAEAGLLAARTDLLEAYAHLDEIGSLYVPDVADDIFINNAIDNIRGQNGMFASAIIDKLNLMKEIGSALSRTYTTVIANPPYMPVSSMEAWAKKWVESNYKDEKTDLCTCFIRRGFSFLVPSGYEAMVTMQSWMFLSSFENMRKWLIENKSLITMAHLGPRAFDAIGGEVVSVSAKVFKNDSSSSAGNYVRLVDENSSEAKRTGLLESIRNPECGWFYKADAHDFEKIPGSPIAYWATPAILSAFEEGTLLGDVVEARQGLATADNDRFLRLWWEVSSENINYYSVSTEDATASEAKWFPYNKGGSFRKWYGNNDYLVNWQNDGEEIKGFVDSNGKQRSRPQNTNFYFKPSVTWSDIASSGTHFRYRPQGSIFDVKGMSCFPQSYKRNSYLAFLNTSLVKEFLKILSPTMSTQIGEVSKIPILKEALSDSCASKLAEENVRIASQDWDAFETSWDFEAHPLTRYGVAGEQPPLETYFHLWKEECEERFNTLKANEEELNRIFAHIYNMEGEVPIEVRDDKVSVRLADKTRDIKSLISYAVGCMFGRYTTDPEHTGLILADQGSTAADFYAKVPMTQDGDNVTKFAIDEDGILPVLEGEWFSDDIVFQFKLWLEHVFGSKHLNENITFIEEALGKDLRTYFVKDFYDDHIKTYQKRPIYWLFSSPNKSFNALVYMHRYDEGTVGDILTKYLRDYVSKLNAAIGPLEASERASDKKLADKYKAQVDELNKWETEVIYPMAHERIAIDLDDGVKVNYNKFPHALRKVTGLSEWK